MTTEIKSEVKTAGKEDYEVIRTFFLDMLLSEIICISRGAEDAIQSQTKLVRSLQDSIMSVEVTPEKKAEYYESNAKLNHMYSSKATLALIMESLEKAASRISISDFYRVNISLHKNSTISLEGITLSCTSPDNFSREVQIKFLQLAKEAIEESLQKILKEG